MLGPTFRTEWSPKWSCPKRPARQVPEKRMVATRRGYNEHIGPDEYRPTSNFVKSIKSLFLTE